MAAILSESVITAEILLYRIETNSGVITLQKDLMALYLISEYVPSMVKAQYLTIAGVGFEDDEYFDYIWAWNDDQINRADPGNLGSSRRVGL